jgi:uncharacterized protein (TIGR00255 family)
VGVLGEEMPIKSMTGFGRGEAQAKSRIWTTELRCVNNRFLDLKIKLPKAYAPLEERIRAIICSTLQRGRVDFAVNVVGDFSDLTTVKVNMEIAGAYKEALVEMAKNLELEEEITPALLASFPDVLIREEEGEDLEAVWNVLRSAVEDALSNCEAMRRQEGEAILADLASRLDTFSSIVEDVAVAVPDLLKQRKAMLQERLEKLLGNVQIDPLRLAQEVVILTDKTDVTEEIVRLRSHIQQFRIFLTEEGTVGRKLDFLVQELLREVNTLGSKISDARIAHLTVELKSELEKMREQIQNIE